MLTIHFTGAGPILMFDGVVLELFYGTRSARAHIGHLKGAHVETDRKGNHELRIETHSGLFAGVPFEERFSTMVKEFIAELDRGIATYSADS